MGFLDRFKRKEKAKKETTEGLFRSDNSFNDLAGMKLSSKRPVLQTKSEHVSDPHAILEGAITELHEYIDKQHKAFGSEGLKALVKLITGEMKNSSENYENYPRLGVKEKLTCLSFFIEDFQIGQPLRFWHVFTKRTPMAQEAYIKIKGKVAKLLKVVTLLDDIAEIQTELENSNLNTLCENAAKDASVSYNEPLEVIELKAKRFEIATTSFKLLQRLIDGLKVDVNPVFSLQSEELIKKLCDDPIKYSESVEITRRKLEARLDVFRKLKDVFISHGLKDEDLTEQSELNSKELQELIKLYQFVIAKQTTEEQERCLYEYLDSLRYSSLLNHREKLRESIKSLYQEQEQSFKMAKNSERDAQLNALMEAEEAIVSLYKSLIDSTNMHPWIVTKLTLPEAIETYIKLLDGNLTVEEDSKKKRWDELRFETKQEELIKRRESSAAFFNDHRSKRDKILHALPGEIVAGDEKVTNYIRDRYKAIERKLPEAGVKAPLTR